MDTNLIITSFAPAIMLFLIALIVRFFPPTRGNNPLIAQAPEWWSRDKKTWDLAYRILGKRYMMYSLILAVICAVLLFLETDYGASIGYILLGTLFFLANFQVRRYMDSKVK